MVSTGFAVADPDFFYPGRKNSGKKLEKNFRIFFEMVRVVGPEPQEELEGRLMPPFSLSRF